MNSVGAKSLDEMKREMIFERKSETFIHDGERGLERTVMSTMAEVVSVPNGTREL
jgi:hypothetical protein